ncbi:MAG: glycosyltransferase [Bryobacteraceae bacterium]
MMQDSAAEKAKWDDFYRDLPLVDPDPETEVFNRRFVTLVDELLPGGGKVLEAGSGAGWQSLALSQTGRFDVTLLDFSPLALDYARRAFAAAGAQARFEPGDLAESAHPEYDLVFNAGVFEHYSLDEQARLLRGMASRSRNYVMVLVPNRRCYWYWVWRGHMASSGQWPWGRETPLADLGEVFAAAGLQLLGHCTLGEATTEYFIRTLAGVGSPLSEEILAVHRSPVVPVEEKGYLTAALGCVGDAVAPPGDSWTRPRGNGAGAIASDEMRSALMDALSLRLAAERRLTAALEREKAADAARSSVEAALAAERAAREALDIRLGEHQRGLDTGFAALGAQLTALERVEQQLGGLQAAASETEQARASLAASESRLSEAENRLTAAEARERDTAARLLASDAKLRQTEAGLAETAQRLRAAESNLSQAEDQLAAVRQELAAHQEQARQLAAEAEAERDRVSEREAAWNKRREDLVQTRDDAIRSASEWAYQNERLTAKLLEAVEHSTDLESQLREARNAHATLLSRADSLRKQTLAGLATLSADLDAKLAAYRSQRAWRVMLGIREAYSKLIRGEGGGALAALRLPFQWLSGSHDLSKYELPFPDPWRFAPDGLQRPLGEALPAAVAPVKPRKFDIVILSIVDFEFRFQRPQQIAVRMAERGHRVYWLSPTRQPTPGGPPFEIMPLREGLWELHIPGVPVDLYGGHLTNEIVDRMMSGLEPFFREHRISESFAYLQFPFWRRLALRMRERLGSLVLYDMMDDWQHWSTPPLIGEPVLADERKLIGETDVFVVTSRAFAERHKENQPPPLLAPNGADFDFFHQGESAGWLSTKPRPIIGYFGAISTWFDVELMTAVVKLRPSYSFIFIGQVHEVDPAEMRAAPNAEFLGERNYRELPSYLADFDVCLIPFRINKVVEGVDPVKMYEYFSQGKPVVATPMRELEHLHDILYLAGTPEEFAQALDRALSEPPGLASKRIDFAKKNTWAARTSLLLDAVEKATPMVSILVVTYNSEEFLDPFLDSIERNTTYPNYEVVLVDNNSTDGSARLLRQRASADTRLRVFDLKENLGFAGGNNLAAREARGEWLLILNPDTIVTPGWIGRLMAPFRAQNPSAGPIGMTAPVTNFSGNETKIDYSYGDLAGMEAFALTLARDKRGETMPLDCVPLLCSLFPRKLWDEVGELDERYTVGMFEDDDFCLRVRRAGYGIVTAEDCFLHHFGNGSFKKLDPAESLRIFNQNRARFESKWGVEWQPHRLRPGVRPVSEEPPMLVREFIAAGAMPQEDAPWAPVLTKLHPPRARAGEPFQLQPNGHYAIAVECERATPYTFIQFGVEKLPTSYAGPRMLTALVRPELTVHAGEVPVRLVSDLGASEPLPFTIE